jgi:hypothetical protein
MKKTECNPKKSKQRTINFKGKEIIVTMDGTLGGVDVGYDKNGKYYAFDKKGNLDCWFKTREDARFFLTL